MRECQHCGMDIPDDGKVATEPLQLLLSASMMVQLARKLLAVVREEHPGGEKFSTGCEACKTADDLETLLDTMGSKGSTNQTEKGR